jgi:hypothetical protein
MMASIYFARSAVELMRDTAKRGGLVLSLAEFDRVIDGLAPRERLLRGLRVRDFHRTPVLGRGYVTLEHSVKLPAYGRAEIELDPNPESPCVRVSVSDGSRNYKFFFAGHGFVQDEREPRAMPLPVMLDELLPQLELCATEFERRLRSSNAG